MNVARLSDMAWRVEGTGDYDGDLRADVLWRNATTGANYIWLAANAGMTLGIASVTDQNWQVAP